MLDDQPFRSLRLLLLRTDSQWRNRSDFFQGTGAIVSFLTKKWEKEHDYRLRKTLWAFDQDKIAVRFEYEFHDGSGQWYRAHGNEVSSDCHMCTVCMLHAVQHSQLA